MHIIPNLQHIEYWNSDGIYTNTLIYKNISTTFLLDPIKFDFPRKRTNAFIIIRKLMQKQIQRLFDQACTPRPQNGIISKYMRSYWLKLDDRLKNEFKEKVNEFYNNNLFYHIKESTVKKTIGPNMENLSDHNLDNLNDHNYDAYNLSDHNQDNLNGHNYDPCNLGDLNLDNLN
ncbi:13821_t:CDS:1, partial [Acaulospora morrowiae]